jgi:hypothetical protein
LKASSNELMWAEILGFPDTLTDFEFFMNSE